MSRAEDRHLAPCPVTGCTNDADAILLLCPRCRALVRREKIDAIREAHGRISSQWSVAMKAKAVLAWNDAGRRAALDAEAWRANHGAR